MASDDDYGRRHHVSHDEHDNGGRPAGPAAPWPGKRTLTQRLVGPASISRKADGDAVAPDAPDRLAAASSSSGAPLPAELRERFEASTGSDLSSVRVHTSAESQQAARAVAARAYAVGDDIHFGAGHYDPSSADGQRLIAHEVAHTVQQGSGSPVRQHKLEVSAPGDAAEVEADRAADAMVIGAPATITSSSPVIARDPPKDPPTAGDDLNAPPPQYATLDPKVRDLLWRSKATFEPFKKAGAKPFWELLDSIGIADLQTCVQVLKGADKAGLGGSIQTVRSIYTYGSSWGLEFNGPTPPVGYPGWGCDLQWFVRREHGNTAHTWYRQDSGAGNPGLHCGVDAGAGYHNLHWDPTNPMSGVGHGVTFVLGPFLIPIPTGAPKGQAIYSPSALIDHAQDIGVLPGGGDPHTPRANQPFLDIAILANNHAKKAQLYADMEAAAGAEHRDKDRAAGAIAQLLGASDGATALNKDARSLAMQDNENNKAAIDDLTAKTDALRKRMFEALANVFAHLHAELVVYGPELAGYDSVAGWTMATDVHSTYDLFAALQKERGRRLKAAKEDGPRPDPLDAGVPLPGGVP